MEYNTEKYVWRRQIKKERLDERIQKKINPTMCWWK